MYSIIALATCMLKDFFLVMMNNYNHLIKELLVGNI